MRYSLDNLVESATVGITNVKDTVLGASALVDRRTTRAYIATQDGASAVEIDVVFDSSADVSLVALVGLTGITGSVTVSLKYLTVEVDSAVVSLQTPVQQTYYVAEFDSVEADECVITFNVGDDAQFGIGYLFVGELSDDLDIADNAINYTIESADPSNITRAGTPLTSTTYLVASAKFGIVEKGFNTMRAHAVVWATAGYATPRLWYFDETCILTGEAIYGIIDSSAMQLDPRWANDGARAVFSLPILEVF